jgi:hypothetical protein
MRITISLNESATERAARTGEKPDLTMLVRKNSEAEVLRVFGRGRFVSVEASQMDFNKLQSALGDICVFALPKRMSPF